MAISKAALEKIAGAGTATDKVAAVVDALLEDQTIPADIAGRIHAALDHGRSALDPALDAKPPKPQAVKH